MCCLLILHSFSSLSEINFFSEGVFDKVSIFGMTVGEIKQPIVEFGNLAFFLHFFIRNITYSTTAPLPQNLSTLVEFICDKRNLFWKTIRDASWTIWLSFGNWIGIHYTPIPWWKVKSLANQLSLGEFWWFFFFARSDWLWSFDLMGWFLYSVQTDRGFSAESWLLV